MERIKESVLPSGVPFAVRNLIGDDQDDLTRTSKKGETAQATFNKMLANAMRRLGSKDDTITPKDIAGMLSNDRKFALVTLRQHTLNYKPTFEFKFEWPLQKGEKKKEVVDYSIDFNHENFPVKPYWWVREAIAKIKDDTDPCYQADGHIKSFPKICDSYGDMLATYKENNGIFSNGIKYKWDLLDGEKEMLYATEVNEDMRMNLLIAMRSPKYLFVSTKETQKDTWATFETGKVDAAILEDLRFEIFDKEGTIDTALVISHPTNRTEKRVDLCQLPAFFFPSLAR